MCVWVASIGLVGLVLAALLFLVWRWRARMHERIDGATLTPDERLSLHISVDSESAKMLAGAAVLLGLFTTGIQILKAQQAADTATVTARLEKGYQILSASTASPALRAGGVYTLESVAEVDPRFTSKIYDSLLAFSRSESQAVCKASALAGCRSTRIDPVTQAVLTSIGDLHEAIPAEQMPANIDLSNTNLREGRLAKLQLGSAHLNESDISGADLQDVVAPGADFFDSNLYFAKLYGIDASGANFVAAWLVRAWAGPPRKNGRAASFDGAGFQGANLPEAMLCEASFKGAHLEGAHLDGVVAYGARFAGSHLANTSFTNAELAGTDFTGAYIEETPDFTCASLAKASVDGDRYCRAQDGTQRELAAATFPADLLKNVKLCRTRTPDGLVVDRDCPKDADGQVQLPTCCRDVPGCMDALLAISSGDYQGFLAGAR